MIYKTMRLLKIGMHGRLRDPLSWVKVVLSVLWLGFNPQLLLGNLLQCLAYPPQESLCTHTHTQQTTICHLVDAIPNTFAWNHYVSVWPKADMLHLFMKSEVRVVASSSFPERSTTLAWDGLAFPSFIMISVQKQKVIEMCPYYSFGLTSILHCLGQSLRRLLVLHLQPPQDLHLHTCQETAIPLLAHTYTGISLGPRLNSFFGGRQDGKRGDEATLEC